MKKKFIFLFIILLCIYVMFVSYASSESYGTEVEYIGNGVEEYYVEVPAKLNPGNRGEVSVYGSWPYNKRVSVYSDKTVTLTNKYNIFEKKTVDVTFNGIDLYGSDSEEVSSLSYISVSDISDEVLFGTWSGRFNYNVEYSEVNMNGYNFRFYLQEQDDKYEVLIENDTIILKPSDYFYLEKNITYDELLNEFNSSNIEVLYYDGMDDYEGMSLEVTKASNDVSFSFQYIGDGIYDFYGIENDVSSLVINKLPVSNEYLSFNEEYVMTYFDSDFAADYNFPVFLRVSKDGLLTYRLNNKIYTGNVFFLEQYVFYENLVYYISDDGTTISYYTNNNNQLIAQWKLSSLIDSYVKFGQKYKVIYEAPGYEDGLLNTNFWFQYDGSIYIGNDSGNTYELAPEGSYIYSGEKVISVDLETGETLDLNVKVSCDGKYVYFYDGDIVTLKLMLASYLYEDEVTSLKFGEKYYVTFLKESLLGPEFEFFEYMILDESGYMTFYLENGDVYNKEAFLRIDGNSIIFEEDNSLSVKLVVSDDGNYAEVGSFSQSNDKDILMKFVHEDAISFRGTTISYSKDVKYYEMDSGRIWTKFKSNGQFLLGVDESVTGDEDESNLVYNLDYKIVDNLVYSNILGETPLAIGQFSDDGKTFYLFDFINRNRRIEYIFSIQ